MAELQDISIKKFIPTTQFGMLYFLTQKQSID